MLIIRDPQPKLEFSTFISAKTKIVGGSPERRPGRVVEKDGGIMVGDVLLIPQTDRSILSDNQSTHVDS